MSATSKASNGVKTMVKCPECPKEFPLPSKLKYHFQAIHRSRTRVPCPICKKLLSSTHRLAEHHKRVHDPSSKTRPKIPCSICDKTFFRTEALKCHMLIHQGLKPFQCLWCENKQFRKLGDLEVHLRYIHTKERPYSCDVCSKSFATSSSRKTHLIVHTTTTVEKTLSCPGSGCKMNFKNKMGLNYHLQRHSACSSPSGLQGKTFKCPLCPRCFYTKPELTIHVTRHTGERAFKCSFCSKSFLDSSSLGRHVQIHTGEKRHGCSLCPKVFQSSSKLKRHQLTHVPKEERGVYPCSTCGKTMPSQEDLLMHTKRHSDPTISCTLCPKKFRTRTELRYHVGRHTKEKPYRCPNCNMLFTKEVYMTNHYKKCQHKTTVRN